MQLSRSEREGGDAPQSIDSKRHASHDLTPLFGRLIDIDELMKPEAIEAGLFRESGRAVDPRIKLDCIGELLAEVDLIAVDHRPDEDAGVEEIIWIGALRDRTRGV